MTNFKNIEKINRLRKRALLVMVFLLVQFVMFGSLYIVHAGDCDSCGGSGTVRSDGYCKSCGAWLCGAGCGRMGCGGYDNECPWCHRWYGEDRCCYCNRSYTWWHDEDNCPKKPCSNHSYGTGTIVTAATCTGTGTIRYTCTNSNCTYSYDESYGPNGHDYYLYSSSAGTCVTQGSETEKCRDCGATSTSNTGIGSHNYVYYSSSAGDCQNKSYTCDRCSYCYDYDYDYGSYGEHDYDFWYTDEGNCVTPDVHWYMCSICDDTTSTSGTVRGYHDWGDWYITDYADCIYTGTQERECSDCGATETQSYGPNGHSYGNWYLWYDSDCTSYGYDRRDCYNCSDYETDSIPPKGHSMGDWYVYQAGHCTLDRILRRECGRSGCDYYEDDNQGYYGSHEYTLPCYCGVSSKKCHRCGAIDYHTNAPIPGYTGSFQYDGTTHYPVSDDDYYSRESTYYATNVGSYIARITIDSSSTHKFSGGVTFKDYSWNITKRPTSLTANNNSKIFGTADPALTVSATNLVSGQSVGYTTPKRDAGENVGSYTIKQGSLALVNNGAFLASNYSMTSFTNGTFTIVPKDIAAVDSINWNFPSSIEYDGTQHRPVPTLVYGGNTMTGASSTLVEGKDYRLSYGTNINVGTGWVTVTGIGNFNGSKTYEFEIYRRTINILADASHKIYGDLDPLPFTYKYNRNVTGEIPAFSGVLQRVEGENIGDYDILQGSLALVNNGSFLASNYVINYTKNTFTIGKLVLSIDKNNPDAPIINEWWLPEDDPNIPMYIYNGDEKKPKTTITYRSDLFGSIVLVENVDYVLSYTNNINAGENTATVTATGISNIEGEFSTTFTILRKKIDDTVITLRSGSTEVNAGTYTYNGDEKKPIVSVNDTTRSEGNVTLAYGSDYTFEYENNVNAGTATVRVTGVGNYQSENTKDYTINRKTISGTTLKLSQYVYEYNGDAHQPSITVYDNERKLYLDVGADYTITYLNNVNAGTATVRVTGVTNYTDYNEINFTIDPKPISKVTPTLVTPEFIYNGAEQETAVKMWDDYRGVYLIQGSTADFYVEYSNHIDAHKSTDAEAPTVTITGVVNYTGTITRTYTIHPKDIYAVWQDKEKFIYNFNPQAPYATAETGVPGESAVVVTTHFTLPNTQDPDGDHYTSTASISQINGGRKRVANYTLRNIYKDFTIYTWPTVPPTITFVDDLGNEINREWYNRDLYVYIDGSSLEGTSGDIGYMYHFNTYPDGSSKTAYTYDYYGENVPYALAWEEPPYQQYNFNEITGTNKFHAENGKNEIFVKAYNTYYEEDENGNRTESGENSRVLTKIEKIIPQMAISSTKEWSKSHTATITLSDKGGSHLKATKYTLQYTWTQSTETPDVYDYSTEMVVGEGLDVVTTQITKDTDYGIWYLHVKLSAPLEDNATNYTEDIVMYGEFWMDNKPPIVRLDKVYDLTVVDKSDIFTIYFELFDEHVGIETSEFTADDIEILLQPSNEVSTAEKTLTYVSTTQEDGIDIHLYRLDLTNVTETGYFNIRVRAGRLADKLGNENITTTFTTDETGLAGDNIIPTIALTGPITVNSITDGRNLSGIIDDRYINQEYEISIPIEVTEVGIIDIVDGLQPEDVVTMAGAVTIEPVVKVTLDSETETQNAVTKVKTYTKKYTVTFSTLMNNGYMFVTFVEGTILDDTENPNIVTTVRPYSIVNEMKYFTFIDNTPPRVIILNASDLKVVNSNATLMFDLKVVDAGAGIRKPEFDVSDILIQLDGIDIPVTVKELDASLLNDHESTLGESVAENYSYTLTIGGIMDEGTLRIAVPGGNIIDKANNGSEAITLEANVVIDNEGPKLGPITTNADSSNQVFGESVIVRIEGCYDNNEIASYEWQRSVDGTNWITISTDHTSSSYSSVNDAAGADGRYYYRVIVSDTVGNSTTSDSVFVDYFEAIVSRPIIRLDQEIAGTGLVDIMATITSTLEITEVTVNGIVIPLGNMSVKKNIYQITTVIEYQATSNGVYTFVAKDTKGNTATESINVNLVDGTIAEITAKTYDATIFANAQIVFTSNEPVRIKDPNGYPGFTFDTQDFTTTIVATISKDIDFEEIKTFEFENKALLTTVVSVEPPIITRLYYLRFAGVPTTSIMITQRKADMLVSKMSDLKVLIENKVVSYYGFGGEKVPVSISDTAEFNAARNLASAGKIEVMDHVGKPINLDASATTSVEENGNYVNGNISGMYDKSGNTMEPTSASLSDNTTTYSAFRVTLRVK